MPSTISLNILSRSPFVIPATVVLTSERPSVGTSVGTSSLASAGAPSLRSLRAFFRGLGQSSFTTTICFLFGLTSCFVLTKVPVGSQQLIVHFHGLRLYITLIMFSAALSLASLSHFGNISPMSFSTKLTTTVCSKEKI